MAPANDRGNFAMNVVKLRLAQRSEISLLGAQYRCAPRTQALPAKCRCGHTNVIRFLLTAREPHESPTIRCGGIRTIAAAGAAVLPNRPWTARKRPVRGSPCTR